MVFLEVELLHLRVGVFIVLVDRDTDKLTDGYGERPWFMITDKCRLGPCFLITDEYGGRLWFIKSDTYGWRPCSWSQFPLTDFLERLWSNLWIPQLCLQLVSSTAVAEGMAKSFLEEFVQFSFRDLLSPLWGSGEKLFLSFPGMEGRIL